MKKIIIYTDGASRDNPGISASGYTIYSEEGSLIIKESSYNGIMSNNMAEYTAILMALEWCNKNMEDISDLEINLFSDSKLVINQINGLYKVKVESLREIKNRITNLTDKFKVVKFVNVPRENRYIKIVDKALNDLLDSIR